MNASQRQAIQTLQRVREYLRESRIAGGPAGQGSTAGAGSAEATAAVSGSSAQRVVAMLDAVVARLEQHMGDQSTSEALKRGETRNKRTLKRVLRNAHMRPIAELARVLLADPTQPLGQVGEGVQETLRLPAENVDTMTLISLARTMAAAVTPHRAVFEGHGLASDFVEQLLAAAEAVNRTLVTRGEHTARRAGATTGVAVDLARGRRLVRLLDSLVAPQLEKTDPRLLAEWRNVKRIGAVMGAPGGSVGEDAPGTTPIVGGAPAPVGDGTQTPKAA